MSADEWETGVREQEKDDAAKTAGLRGEKSNGYGGCRSKGGRRGGMLREGGEGSVVFSERSVCRPGASSVAAHHPDRLGAAVMSARRVRVSDAADVHVLDAQRRDRLLPRV